MKKGTKNIITGIVGQLLILLVGIVVPRFVISNYGDESNGLISAIGQLFTYLGLIEAGVGQSSLQALYKPVTENNHHEISRIINATKQMFGKLTIGYGVIVILFALIYPFMISINSHETISFMGSTYLAVFLLVFFQGLSNAVGFYYSATIKQLLTADGCNYIIVNITTAIRLATSILRVLLMNLQVNIVTLQFVYVVMAVVEAVFYQKIIKSKYHWLEDSVDPDFDALIQRKSFVVHETANVIFNSTDVLLLSLFCSLSTASIYSVYSLVFNALATLISQVHSGCFYILGQQYSQSKTRYVNVHDVYDTLYMAFVFSLMTTAYIMILPFIQLYTSDVTDVIYVDAWLPMLFTLIQLLSCCRITSSNLIKLAGHARKTVYRAIAEATINLIVSIILVQFIGIYGVLLGTITALLYRTNDMIIYANKKIIKRSCKKTYKIVLSNFILFAIFVLGAKYIPMNFIDNYIVFFAVAALICLIAVVLFFTVALFFNEEARRFVVSVFRRIKHRSL